MATITINLAIGDNGIIKQAKNAKEDAEGTIESVDKNMNKLLDDYFNLMSGGGGGTEPGEDRTPPTVEIVVGEITEKSIAITANATDDSGEIAKYVYHINGKEPQESTTNTYKYDGLTAGTEYTIKVEAFDEAGNRGENSTVVSTTKTIPPGGSVTEDGVPIPGGFYYVGGKINDGVVISDNVADKDKGTSHSTAQTLQGNQFVWVPVPDPSTMFKEETVTLTGVSTNTNVYSKLRIRSEDSTNFTSGKPGDSSSVREPDVIKTSDTDSENYSILGYNSTKEMADAFVTEYKAMYESVKKYKGFYIGRYELTGTVLILKSKVGTVLTNQNWYNLKKACSNMISNQYAQSTMIYGCQWDETMNWIISSGAKSSEQVIVNSSSWANYNITLGGTGQKQPTGSNEKWKVNNIYNLAGNCLEWTQEASPYSRLTRGYGYNFTGGGNHSASERFISNHTTTSETDYFTSRPVLYIK